MRRIQYHQYGGPEVMRLEEFEPAPLGPHQVLVRVRAAAANPMDFGIRAGAMKMVTGRRFPRAMGNDFAGVVEAVGDGVARLHVGDAVLGGTPIRAAGAFADVVVAEEKGLVVKPSSLSFEDAASLPTPGITALQALTKVGRLKEGDTVFVHGCLGAVGRSAVQIAMSRGALVGGSCRSTAAEEARTLGIEPVVDFEFDPAPLAGRFDIVLDTADTLPMSTARTMLRSGGRIVGLHPTPVKLLRSAVPGPSHTLIAQPVTSDLEEVAQAAGHGHLRLPIAEVVTLSQAVPALTALEQNQLGKRGKLIIEPD